VADVATPWGGDEARCFFELTPDRMLDAVEDAGVRTTGRVLQLASMENRVYQVEIELDEQQAQEARSASDAFRVVKFYRPGRWTREQILDEHRFLAELVEDEVPVVAPSEIPGSGTLGEAKGLGILWAIFPRVGGRAPDELDSDQLAQLGRLVARLHQTGASGTADSRLRLDIETYGYGNLELLRASDVLPTSVAERYEALVEGICDLSAPWFEQVDYQRIHGDCHAGNVLWNDAGPFLVDFDDMVRGPCVQDLWLLAPGQDAEAVERRNRLLEGYELLRDFDRSSLRLIEPLRGLRLVHFSAWIAKRYEDPAFQRAFPDFGGERYWFEETSALQEVLARVQDSAWG
jgi:Ser/Thr protein kinase RdoA (MazF antagonist)